MRKKRKDEEDDKYGKKNNLEYMIEDEGED